MSISRQVKKIINARLKKHSARIADEALKLAKINLDKGNQPFSTKALPALSNATIKHREYLERHGNMVAGTSPSTSNLKMSNQLWESLKTTMRVVGTKSIIKLFASGRRKKYKGAGGKPIGKSISNNRVFDHLVERNFINRKPDTKFNDGFRKIIAKIIRRG